ncbi:hypothetical protein Syun_004220 [Stephania yunnanensis]|uniref:Uncharacterized protein n=1 Tax=Stephania yunnanensis TaxID=152371 RepID=A0AAP0L2M0_9MAGN
MAADCGSNASDADAAPTRPWNSGAVDEHGSDVCHGVRSNGSDGGELEEAGRTALVRATRLCGRIRGRLRRGRPARTRRTAAEAQTTAPGGGCSRGGRKREEREEGGGLVKVDDRSHLKKCRSWLDLWNERDLELRTPLKAMICEAVYIKLLA